MNLPNGTNDLVTLKPWGPTLVDNRPLSIEPLARSSPAKGLLGTLLASLFLVQCSMWLCNLRPALANSSRIFSTLCQSGWGPEQHIRRRSLNSVAIHPNWLDNRTKTPHVPLQLVASTAMTQKLSQPSRLTEFMFSAQKQPFGYTGNKKHNEKTQSTTNLQHIRILFSTFCAITMSTMIRIWA